jgi:hypothetical protein
MICSNCGTMLDDGLKFCSECGANLSDPDDRPRASRKSPKHEASEYGESWYEDSSYPAKKPAERMPPELPHYQEQTEPQRVIIEHARKKGDDISTSFGSTIGRKAGGCVWSLIVIGAIILIFVFIGLTIK